MTKFITTLVLIFLALLAFQTFFGSANAQSCGAGYEPSDYGCVQFITTHAVLRSDNNGNWSIYETTSHPSNNVGALTQYSSYLSLEIDTNNQGVIHAEATPDEQVALQGVVCGVSGGVSAANIYCGDENGGLDPDEITGTTTNLWVKVEGFIRE